jgi:glutaredoxin 3
MSTHTISIYSTPACHFCHMAKELFKEEGITYTEFNVAEDAEKRKEMVEMTGQMGVPVIVIDNDVLVGFNEPKIRELLGLTGERSMAV